MVVWCFLSEPLIQILSSTCSKLVESDERIEEEALQQPGIQAIILKPNYTSVSQRPCDNGLL